METILKIKQLTKKYGKFTALNKASIQIEKGDIYGLVGNNGAGKTTLMKMICGITTPTAGSFELFGKEKTLDLERQRIGSIIETPEFFPYFNGEQNLEYFRLQRGIVNKESIKEVLEMVGLKDVSKKFKKYSLGMKQRLGIALALIGNPDFLILDEPINGIDPEGIVELRELFLRLNKEKNISILISSHILTELKNIVNKLAFLDQGSILEEISMQELKEKTGNYLELSVDDPFKTVVILEETFKYTNFKVKDNNNIFLYEGFEQIAAINKALVEADISIIKINQKTNSLEDYYLQLIGGRKNV